jgi:hypothetical protein
VTNGTAATLDEAKAKYRAAWGGSSAMNTVLLAQLWAKLTQLKPHVLKITAAILLLISIVLALLDRIAAGSLVAALFVVVALFDFLPQLESLPHSASRPNGESSWMTNFPRKTQRS